MMCATNNSIDRTAFEEDAHLAGECGADKWRSETIPTLRGDSGRLCDEDVELILQDLAELCRGFSVLYSPMSFSEE